MRRAPFLPAWLLVVATALGCSSSDSTDPTSDAQSASSEGSSGAPSGASSSGSNPSAYKLVFHATGAQGAPPPGGMVTGTWVVRDVATGEHVAFGDFTPGETIAFETDAVLVVGGSYEVGISQQGRYQCAAYPAMGVGVFFERVDDVQADVQLERTYADVYDPQGCEVINVKSKAPPGAYRVDAPRPDVPAGDGSFVTVQVSRTGAVYRTSARVHCPESPDCYGLTNGSCAPIAVEEDQSFHAGLGAGQRGLGVDYALGGDQLVVEAHFTGSCCTPDYPFQGSVGAEPGALPEDCP